MKKNLLTNSKRITVVVIISFLASYTAFAQLGENQLTNGDFENGITGWEAKFQGSASGELTHDAGAGVGGSGAGKVVMTSTETVNKANIFAPEMALETAQYLFGGSIKGDGEYLVRLGLQGWNADHSKAKYPQFVPEKDFETSAEYQNIRAFITMRDGYTAETYFRWQVGQDAGTYYFDNVTFQKVIDFPNSGFEDEELLFGWRTHVETAFGAAAEFSAETTDYTEGSTALKVNVTASDDTTGHVSLTSEYTHFVDAGVETEFSFDAKASTAGDSIWVFVQYFTFDPESTVISSAGSLADSIALTTSFENYKLPFTIDESIYYVKYKIDLGNQASTYVFDNFSAGADSDLSIDSDPLTTAMVGTLYSYQVSSTGVGTFSLETDPTADWLSISETGLVSGTPTEAGAVDVTIKLSDGTTEVSQSYTLNINPVSVNSNNMNTINVYPNPATDILNITAAEGSRLNIYTVTGKQLRNERLNSNNSQINISDLQNGIYVVSVINGANSKTLKLVVE